MAGVGKKILEFIGLESTEVDGDDGYYVDDRDDMPGYENDDFMMEDEKKYANKKRDRNREMEREVVAPKYSNFHDTSKVRVLIFKPVSYDDSQSIIDHLKENKPIIVNLDELENEVAQRILDFVSGAVYALDGNIRKAARNIFVVAPCNIDVSTNVAEGATSVDNGFNFENYLDK